MQASRCTAAAVPAAPVATNRQRCRRRVVRAAAARRPAASQQQRDADRQQEAQQPQQLGLSPLQKVATGAAGLLASAVLLTAPGSALAADTAAVGTCLLQNCQAALAQCLTDVTCAENLVCLQLCNGRPDETECQIKCGDKYSDKAVETFTACAVSEKKCVPQRIDEDAYPVPPDSALDNSFDLSNFQGRWYITAGLNPLFDTFDCQEHFFASPEPNKVFAKINWRIPMSDALTGDQDFIERSVMQKFVQEDPAKQPSVLVNKDNEFLNYQDTWYVLAFKPDNYVFIYYRGQNDAWLGYGGATVYTRASTLPREDIPELKAAAERAGLDWSKFTITNNSCPPHPPKAALPEKLRVAAVRRTAQAEYELENDLRSFGRGFTVLEKDLSNKLRRTENTIVEDIKAVGQVEKKLEQTAGKAEKLIEKEVEEVEAAAARMIRRFEAEAKMGPWINWIPKSWRPVIMPMD